MDEGELLKHLEDHRILRYFVEEYFFRVLCANADIHLFLHGEEFYIKLSLSEFLNYTASKLKEDKKAYRVILSILSKINKLRIKILLSKVYKGFSSTIKSFEQDLVSCTKPGNTEELTSFRGHFYALKKPELLSISIVLKDNVSVPEPERPHPIFTIFHPLSTPEIILKSIENISRKFPSGNELLLLETSYSSYIIESIKYSLKCDAEVIDLRTFTSLKAFMKQAPAEAKIYVIHNFELAMKFIKKQTSEDSLETTRQFRQLLASVKEKFPMVLLLLDATSKGNFGEFLKQEIGILINLDEHVDNDAVRIASILEISPFEKSHQKIMFAESLLTSTIFSSNQTEGDICACIVKECKAPAVSKLISIDDISIPKVTWDDVGGLEEAKKEIRETLILTQKYSKFLVPQLGRRAGILFYGPPGTGKTLLAKCIANECGLNFISVKGPELLNMYVGESEKNVRDVFKKARDNQPSILFFDEIDSLLPKRGNSQDSSSVTDRLVAQFLIEMDTCLHAGNIFIVGATNRPDLVDPSMLQPGRFDVMIYLGVDNNLDTRIGILKAQTRKLKLKDSLEEIEKIMPQDLTGAGVFEFVSNAYKKALKQKKKEITERFGEIISSSGRKGIREAIQHLNPAELEISLELHHFL